MNTEEVAKKVVEFVRRQAWHEAVDALYDKDIVSVEARTQDGSSPETRGIDGVRGKVDGKLVLAGNEKLLAESKVDNHNLLPQAQEPVGSSPVMAVAV